MSKRRLMVGTALVRPILPLLRRMPRAAVTRHVAWIGHAEYALFPPVRAQFKEAAERGNAHFGGRWNPSELARELAGNHISWWLRDRLLDGLPDDSVVAQFTVSGREHLDLARAKGLGVILLGNHFGAHLLPSHWLIRAGFPIRWYTERPRRVSRYLQAQYRTEGPLGQSKLFISRNADRAEAARSILRAVRVLRAGLMLCVTCDTRWTGRQTVPGVSSGGPIGSRRSGSHLPQ